MFCYLRDWENLVDKMNQLGSLPDRANLFTVEATLMYTNIDTDHNLEVLRLWLNKLKQERKIAKDYPIDLII